MLFKPVTETDQTEAESAILRVSSWWRTYHEAAVARLEAQIAELKARVRELEAGSHGN